MTELGDVSMSPGSITALAAIFGSLVGALGSSISTWITQRHQDRRDLLARKVFHREQLYSDFITESARLGGRFGEGRIVFGFPLASA
jgi:hypothetical protein